MGEEDFKVAQGVAGGKELFSFKEEQHLSMNQTDFCSLHLNTLESPSQRGYHLRESPSLPSSNPYMCWLWVQMKFTSEFE